MDSKSNDPFGFSNSSVYVEDIYHKMIDEIEDYAILMMDTNGFIINWNKGAEKIKGYKESEIISKNFRQFYTKEDQESGLPERLLELGRRTGKASHEGWRVRKDGTKFWGSIVITAIHNEQGEVIGFSKVTRDLTERKLTEDKMRADAEELSKVNKELMAAQEKLANKIDELNRANKDLEQFTYIASHDLQEPIRKISTYFSMFCALNEEKFDERSRSLKDRIFSATKRMQTLINDLLALSTITEEKDLVPVDLNKVLKEAVEEFDLKIEERNARIIVGTLPRVIGIESYLVQLFLNLISNSLKFSEKDPLIEISASTENGMAIIQVKDNGIGMDELYNKKIFEPFQRLHSKHEYEGSGIGLAICKKIVEVQNGTIAVESEVGKGTTFTISFPLA
jgi:PAS domain S-box-containing protein